MKLLWASDVATFQHGGGGYTVHSFKMQEALRAAGIIITRDPTENYDLAVHIIRPDRFYPIPGKPNLLFTMTEVTEPVVWGPTVKDATVLVTPCKYSADVFARHYSGPIEICQEGCDPERFPFIERKAPGPGEPFVFLYVGNDFFGVRKGACWAYSAWKKWLASGRMPVHCQLYMKTTEIPGPELQYYQDYEGRLMPDQMMTAMQPILDAGGPRADQLQALMAKMPPRRIAPLITDCRHLSVAELVQLYGRAHAFLFPTLGEGWGLTLTDGLATGIPAIWTHNTAMLDYADESIGYPLTDLSPVPFWPPGENKRGTRDELLARPALVGDPIYYGSGPSDDGIIEAMEKLMGDYPGSRAPRQGSIRALSSVLHLGARCRAVH